MKEILTLPIPDVCFIEYPDQLPLPITVFLHEKEEKQAETSWPIRAVTDPEIPVSTELWKSVTLPNVFFAIEPRAQLERCNFIADLENGIPLSRFLPTHFWVEWLRAIAAGDSSRPLLELDDIERLKQYLNVKPKDIRVTVSPSLVGSQKPERHRTIRCITAGQLLWQEAFESADDND